jgi:signal transduction histidine kinase
MVHELRTPLAALKASTALLQRPNLPPNRRDDILVTMQEETERLSQMTTSFLDLARLESGRTRLKRERFDIHAMMEECATIVQPQASERRIQISVEGESMNVEADYDKIKQVLLNLLTNAVKYNRDDGAIYCHVESREDIDSNCPPCCILVSVRDTGRGIKAEDQGHVFEKFFRVADTAGEVQGTGLGLSIAKRIIEAHGCDMGLTSEMNVGTTFYFTLPAAPAS